MTNVDRESRLFLEKAAKSGLKEVHLSRLAVERAQNPAVRDYATMLISEHQQANMRLAGLATSRGVSVAGGGMMGTNAAKHSMLPDSQSPGVAGSAGATGSTGTSGTSGSVGSPSATPRTATGGQAGTQAPAGGSASARTGTGSGMASSSSTMGSSSSGSMDTATTEAMREIQEDAQELAEKTGAEFDREYVEAMIEDHKETIDLFEKASERAQDPEVKSFAQSTLPKLRAHLTRAESLQRQVKG